MKKIIIPILVLFMVGCGAKSGSEDKNAELTRLKTELNEIQNKIAKLESEIESENKSSNASSFKFPVVVKKLTLEHFNHFIEVTGNIEAVNAAYISSEIPGQIVEIYVKEGDRVDKDQTLVKLNTNTIEKSIDEVKTSLELATTIFNKQKNLWDQKIGSEVDYLTAKNNKESLERKLESLNAQLDLAYIKAPFPGIVDDIILKEGELVMPGVQIMQMVNLDQLYINADVAERYLPVIRKGDKVSLSFPTFPELNTEVPIYRVGNIIDLQNRTVNIQVFVNNTHEKLKPNGLAVIQINDYATDEALVVPSIIIKQDMKGSFLYILKKEGKKTVAKKRYVKSGVFYKDQSMIVEGLKVGDRVIVEGYNQISDGSEVYIKK